MSRRHPARFAKDCGDGAITGPPEQGSGKAPAFSVPRERLTPPPPTEKPKAFWRDGMRHHRRERRSNSSPAAEGSRAGQPRQPFGRRSFRAALGGGKAATTRTEDPGWVTSSGDAVAAAPLDAGGLIAPTGGPAPMRSGSVLRDGCLTSPGKDSLRFQGDLASEKPDDEDGLVTAAGGAGGQENAEQDGEVHGREVGYKVAGWYVARAAVSPNALPLPPLYHLMEVAHRQQRRELEQRFAAKEAKLKEEQDSLRSQLRLLEAISSKAESDHQPEPDKLTKLMGTAGCGDAKKQNTNNKVEDHGGGDGKTAGEAAAMTIDKPGTSAAPDGDKGTATDKRGGVESTTNSGSGMVDTSIDSPTNRNNVNAVDDTTSAISLKNKIDDSGGSGSGITDRFTLAAERIKAARKAVSTSLDELVSSGRRLEGMRKEADQARRRVLRLISEDSGVAAAGSTARGSTVGFLQVISPAWVKLSTEAKTRILSIIERDLGLPQQSLSERTSTLPGPTEDEEIGAVDGGQGVGDGGGGGGSGGEVQPLPRQRSVTPAAGGGLIRPADRDFTAAMKAVKDKLRSTQEQLSTSKALETTATARASEAEGVADCLRVQLEARKRQITEMWGISQGNLVRTQRRLEKLGLGDERPGF
eukprot:g3344.t1